MIILNYVMQSIKKFNKIYKNYVPLYIKWLKWDKKRIIYVRPEPENHSQKSPMDGLQTKI